MLSSNAVTEPPPLNILAAEGERSIAASSRLRAMRTESALDLDSLVEVGLLASEYLVDEKIDLVRLLRRDWILAELWMRFMINSSLSSQVGQRFSTLWSEPPRIGQQNLRLL